MTPPPRSYSPYAREAAQLLGAQIQSARHERRMTERDLAERAGISAPTLRRIERGDMGVGIGLAFEVASLLGVPLFHDDASRLSADLAHAQERLALLPSRVRARPSRQVDDDF